MKNKKFCPICIAKKVAGKAKVSQVAKGAYGNGVAMTPPMGWSSWNLFRNKISEDLIKEILASDIEAGSIENILPTLTASPSKKVAAGDNALTYVYENASSALYEDCCSKLTAESFAQYTENEYLQRSHSADDDSRYRVYSAPCAPAQREKVAAKPI